MHGRVVLVRNGEKDAEQEADYFATDSTKVRGVSRPAEVSYSSSYTIYKAIHNLRYSTFSNIQLGITPQTVHLSQSLIQYDLWGG